MKQILVVNGIEGPLRHLFGCDCDRCLALTVQANTSVSLLSLDDQGETVHHTLFDIGMGVVDSLVRSPYLRGKKARLDGLALTHWHPDHTLGLNPLLVAHYLMRKRRNLATPKVPIWCRSGTAAWVAHNYDFEWTNFLEPRLSGENEPPGSVLPPLAIDLPDVVVTPVTVSHFNADHAPNGRAGHDPAQEMCYTCAGYVIQSARTKIVLLWDIDSENEWMVSPRTTAQKEAVDLLAGADHLFIDTAFWQAKDGRTSHPTFTNVRRYARALFPAETLLIHLSGHPDGPNNPGYGWTNARWQTEAMKVWARERLPGQVRVPAIGEEFILAD